MKNKLLNYNYYIKEGLIHTFPISIYYNRLYDNISFLNNKGIDFKIDIDYSNENFKIELSKIYFDEIIIIDTYCGSLGYYLTKFKVYKNNNSNIIKYNHDTFDKDINNNDGLILYYESKFDNIIKIDEELLYHATNIKNLEGILKNGLYPKSESKIEYHYERIYLSENLNDCIKIIPKLRIFSSNNIKDYIIFEMNSSNNKYYKDSKSNGIYTYENISKNNIKLLNNIYTQYDIINFDNYNINKLSNPVYVEFFKNDSLVYMIKRKDMNKKY